MTITSINFHAMFLGITVESIKCGFITDIKILIAHVGVFAINTSTLSDNQKNPVLSLKSIIF